MTNPGKPNRLDALISVMLAVMGVVVASGIAWILMWSLLPGPLSDHVFFSAAGAVLSALILLWVGAWLASKGGMAPERAGPGGRERFRELREVQVVVGKGTGGEARISPRILPEKVKRIDWDFLDHGLALLHGQLSGSSFDMVIGVKRGGLAIADMLRLGERFPLGYVHLGGPQGNRHIVTASSHFPAHGGAQADAKILVVDWLFKTGSALDTIFHQCLEPRGFTMGNTHIAALCFGLLGEVPEKDDPVPLSAEHFPHCGDAEPGTFRPWLKQLRYVSYLSTGHPGKPWKY